MARRIVTNPHDTGSKFFIAPDGSKICPGADDVPYSDDLQVGRLGNTFEVICPELPDVATAAQIKTLEDLIIRWAKRRTLNEIKMSITPSMLEYGEHKAPRLVISGSHMEHDRACALAAKVTEWITEKKWEVKDDNPPAGTANQPAPPENNDPPAGDANPPAGDANPPAGTADNNPPAGDANPPAGTTDSNPPAGDANPPTPPANNNPPAGTANQPAPPSCPSYLRQEDWDMINLIMGMPE